MKQSLVLLLLGAAACTPDAIETTTQGQQVVYGEDDRTDYYAETREDLRELTHASIVAMMENGDLDMSDPSDVQISGDVFGPSYGLCEGELFYDQLNAADCSATLIDDNLVLTAGHCMQRQERCNQVSFVFNYYMASETELATVTTDDVYACEELLVTEVTDSGGQQLDYAIVRLDRPVVGHSPAEFNTDLNPLTEGDSVTVIGYGSGLPAKIDDGGVVLDARSGTGDYFSATTDTFGGNSGSGVFDADNLLVGILVRGDQDYTWDGGCLSVNYLSEEGGRMGGEGITYAHRAVADLCASGYPSERLCATESECGDGFCSLGETFDSCPEDCEEVVDPLEGWTCDPDYYGTLDGCDCGCGIYDPDCDNPRQDVLNCAPNQFCNADGECEDNTVDPEDVGVPDTGMPDTGVEETDTGVEETDTGVAEPDVEADTTEADASETDADETDADNNGERPGSGSEGCTQSPAAPAPHWALALIGLVAWRRRRR